MAEQFAALTTETANPNTEGIDQCGTLELLEMINLQDRLVPGAVAEELPNIARAVDLLTDRLGNGGRMIYIGAGTSGRLGVLDASECPPTFSTPPELVQGFIAGGDKALRTPVEGCEDDLEGGAQLVKELALTEKDVLVGITASGRAPYVVGAAEQARAQGASVIGVSNNKGSALEKCSDISISPVVGPEVILGSTRMKAGTAQKLVLNMLTTATMIRLGKVYGNLMVDLNVSNSKLYDRAVRIVSMAAGTGAEASEQALKEAGMSAKLAILMLKTGLEKEAAKARLAQCRGMLRAAVEMGG